MSQAVAVPIEIESHMSITPGSGIGCQETEEGLKVVTDSDNSIKMQISVEHGEAATISSLQTVRIVPIKIEKKSDSEISSDDYVKQNTNRAINNNTRTKCVPIDLENKNLTSFNSSLKTVS